MAGVQKIDHVAIAVRSIAESRVPFEELYGARYLGQKENTAQEYIVAYFLMGESLITMLEGTTPESFVTKHVETRGEGIQHMGVEVDDLDEFVEQLEAGGARVSAKRTIEGIRKEALISPRSAFGIIMQPIEWLGDLRDEPHHERIIKAGGL
jgi:methylmalonyl-CoA/ethylmalonyl-CoA epimerase